MSRKTDSNVYYEKRIIYKGWKTPEGSSGVFFYHGPLDVQRTPASSCDFIISTSFVVMPV